MEVQHDGSGRQTAMNPRAEGTGEALGVDATAEECAVRTQKKAKIPYRSTLGASLHLSTVNASSTTQQRLPGASCEQRVPCLTVLKWHWHAQGCYIAVTGLAQIQEVRTMRYHT